MGENGLIGQVWGEMGEGFYALAFFVIITTMFGGEAVSALRLAGILPAERNKGRMPSPRETRARCPRHVKQGQDALAT
jgi:hypothetical protein